MNALRRFCLAIYSLLLIAACGALIALTWADNEQFNWTIGGWNFQAFVDSSDAGKIVFTIILAAIAVVGLLTLILAVFRESVRAQRGSLRMRQADGGTIEVTGRAIEALLRDELQRLPDVRSVATRVRIVGGAVDTNLDATIAPTANIATVTSTLSQGVANILRDQVGVTNVRRPTIRIAQDESSGYDRSYTPAAPAAAAPADGGYGQRPADDSYRRFEPVRDDQQANTPAPPPAAPATSPTELPPPPAMPAANESGSADDAGRREGALVPPASVEAPVSAEGDQSRPAVADRWAGDHWESDRS
jgi:hypothetical protein